MFEGMNINLGNVKGLTPKLRLEGKVIQVKYDNEVEWRDLFEFPDDSGSGVLVVDKFSDLPAQAKKGDVAFVKTEELRETVNRIDKAKINVQGLDVTHFEIETNANFVTDEMLEGISPELVGKTVMFGARLAGPSCEIEIQCIHYTPEMFSQQMGVNHGVDCHYIMQYNSDDTMTQWFKLKGISVKDYLTLMMEFPGTEEQIKTLLGEHYEDKTEDNPSYNWIKVIQSESPVNNNSVDLDGMYFTVIYDDESNYSFNAIPFGFVGSAVNSDGESLFDIEFTFEDLDEYEPSEVEMYLNYANTFLNLMFFGGMEEIKYDIFHKKGFYRFDEEWNSLEDEMNIPKVAKTFADLPKSFIENGLMVVATDEVVLPEPSSTVESMSSVQLQVNPTPSIADEISHLKQYFIEKGAPSDIVQSEYMVMLGVDYMSPSAEYSDELVFGVVSDNQVEGIKITSSKTIDGDYYEYTTVYCYFIQPGAVITLPKMDWNSQDTDYTFDEGCWYVYQTKDDGKRTFTSQTPTKVSSPLGINLSGVLVGEIYAAYSNGDSGDEMTLSSYEFNNVVSFIDESKKIVHNRGFYKFSEDKWHHQPEIAGAVFENADILKCITEEDLGNFHSHDNQGILDLFNNSQQVHSHTNSAILAQIGYDHVHTHSNKYYLDQITESAHVHKHTNKDVVDKLGFSDDLLTYNGELVGSPIKTVVSQDVLSISVKAGTFVKAKARDNAAYQSFAAVLELYEGNDMKEYAFSIDTTNLTFNHTLYINMQFKEGSSVNIKPPIWLSDELLYLEPNRYYEISVLDGKAIYTSAEVGE